jgi:hypothetical protein
MSARLAINDLPMNAKVSAYGLSSFLPFPCISPAGAQSLNAKIGIPHPAKKHE